MAKQAGEPMSCSIMKAAAAEPDAAELLPVDFALPKTMCAPPWIAAAGLLQLRLLRLHWGPLTGVQAASAVEWILSNAGSTVLYGNSPILLRVLVQAALRSDVVRACDACRGQHAGGRTRRRRLT